MVTIFLETRLKIHLQLSQERISHKHIGSFPMLQVRKVTALNPMCKRSFCAKGVGLLKGSRSCLYSLLLTKLLCLGFFPTSWKSLLLPGVARWRENGSCDEWVHTALPAGGTGESLWEGKCLHFRVVFVCSEQR